MKKKSVKKRKSTTSGSTSPQKKDFRFLSQSLKDEADSTKKLYHPDLVD